MIIAKNRLNNKTGFMKARTQDSKPTTTKFVAGIFKGVEDSNGAFEDLGCNYVAVVKTNRKKLIPAKVRECFMGAVGLKYDQYPYDKVPLETEVFFTVEDDKIKIYAL